jgi:hypothetical protein
MIRWLKRLFCRHGDFEVSTDYCRRLYHFTCIRCGKTITKSDQWVKTRFTK